MSETAANAAPSVPPKLTVSKPADEVANTSGRRSLASRRRSAGPRPVLHEHGRSGSSEWIDIDESPPRRRKSSRRSSGRQERSSKSVSLSQPSQRGSESELGRFFPRLSRILETSESATSSRPSTRGSDTRSRRDRSPARRHRRPDDTGSVYHRPVKHRTGGVQRRNESGLRINPSLLSVLSGLTTSTDRSSGSNSTVTQQSYDQRSSEGSTMSTGKYKHSRSKLEANFSNSNRPRSPNVFDYMVASSVDEDHDGRSIMSSSSASQYEPSLAGSSEAPDTPSSRSTFPSPTTTRSQSVAELRRRYDPQYAGSDASSVRSGANSPGSSAQCLRQPSVSAINEDDEQGSTMEPTAPSELNYDPRQRSLSRSSRSSQRSTGRMSAQEEAMRQHMAHTQHAQSGHHVDPVYGQHRSSSTSSTHSTPYQYQHMAMQQYQWPSPPALPPQPAVMNDHIERTGRPPAPEAPDLTKRTVAGYEMLALELSSTESPLEPLYRKFEYLNHRILLHLQDELCELEEQLRTLDEIIAQMDPALAEGQRTPASRRGEAYSGGEMHYQRTHLLGRIFVKTEQYNRAMTAYTGMSKTSTQAEGDQVETYEQWMKKHAPVHEVEARFLQRRDDLVAPGKHEAALDRPTRHAALAYLPVALMLPLLLFSIIPTLAGRLAVTALIAAGAFLVAGTTSIRHMLPLREWAVCGAAYVLLMAAIAGCIPQHS